MIFQGLNLHSVIVEDLQPSGAECLSYPTSLCLCVLIARSHFSPTTLLCIPLTLPSSPTAYLYSVCCMYDSLWLWPKRDITLRQRSYLKRQLRERLLKFSGTCLKYRRFPEPHTLSGFIARRALKHTLSKHKWKAIKAIISWCNAAWHEMVKRNDSQTEIQLSWQPQDEAKAAGESICSRRGNRELWYRWDEGKRGSEEGRKAGWVKRSKAVGKEEGKKQRRK